MPYKRLGDANRAILGVRPRVTLAQANEIAGMADAIAGDNPDGAWAIAISQWKKSHVVRGGRWVKRRKTTTAAGEVIYVGVEDMPDIEEVTKTVAGKQHPASDFLVVEDPESPDTWHLQVRDGGEPDHRLMGAAWAALHGGYRGNKYEGPKKSDALRKLKALYKAEKMPLPGGASEMAERDSEYVPFGITSFEALMIAQDAREAADTAQELASQFSQIVVNILMSDMPGKIAAIRAAGEEFMTLLGDVLDEQSGDEAAETAQFGEADAGAQRVQLSEAEAAGEPLLVMDMAIIAPGWGNKRDNNYYSREVLEKHAEKFAGAMVYATDHREDEKNVLTQVGRIRAIKGFTDSGAPIGEVAIWRGDLAGDIRRRNDAHELDTLHCSILARGRVREGFERDGRRGRYVESIDEVASVDLVTKAGAGGHALRLVENDGGTMNETEEKVQDVNAGEETAELREAQQPDVTPEDVSQAEAQPPPAQELQPQRLTEADVAAALDISSLPAWAREWVAEAQYATRAELDKAIERALARVVRATGSGQPFGLGETATRADNSKTVNIAEQQAAVNKKFLGR